MLFQLQLISYHYFVMCWLLMLTEQNVYVDPDSAFLVLNQKKQHDIQVIVIEDDDIQTREMSNLYYYLDIDPNE